MQVRLANRLHGLDIVASSVFAANEVTEALFSDTAPQSLLDFFAKHLPQD